MGSPAQPSISTFNYPNMGGAAQNTLGEIGGLTSSPFSDITGLAGNVASYVQNLFGGGQTTVPSAQGGITTAQNLSPAATNVSGGSIGTAAGIQGGVNSLVPYAMSLEQWGANPQSGLYNQYLNQTTQQAGTSAANAGVLNSPYGQSVIGSDIGQFNNMWNQYLLQNAVTAGGAANSILGGAASTGQGAQNLGISGLTGGVGSALTPWSTAQQIGATSLQDLASGANLGTSFAGLPQMSIGDYLSYLSGGTGAMAASNQASIGAYNAQTAAQQAQFNEYSQLGGGLVNFANLGGAMGPFGAFGAFSQAA
jgi:hypothetical protein